jgi:hypothetical protein
MVKTIIFYVGLLTSLRCDGKITDCTERQVDYCFDAAYDPRQDRLFVVAGKPGLYIFDIVEGFERWIYWSLSPVGGLMGSEVRSKNTAKKGRISREVAILSGLLPLCAGYYVTSPVDVGKCPFNVSGSE